MPYYHRRPFMSAVLTAVHVGHGYGQDPGQIPKDSWAEFTSPDKRYKLLMPGKPELQKPGKGISTDTKMYLVELKSSAFVVAATEIPPRLMKGMTVENRLKAAGKGFADRTPGAKVASEKKIELDTHAGREFVIDAGDKTEYVVRAYLVENRLYLLAAGGKEFSAEHADVVKFLSSFKLKYAVNAAATSFDGLLGYWSFDEDDAKAAKDSAGGNHPAALH